MDFHSLTRKELQALCKLNKIPANLTNIAMADSLAALQQVEGLEELLNQSQSEPQNFAEDDTNVIGSPEAPRTSCRTSTRIRKPVNKEASESAQPMTRTRQARKNQSFVEETEVVDPERREVPPKTPAALSTRRRVPLLSAAKKTETRNDEIGSVQRAYSTRRSVRLLEQTLENLSLGPVKIEDVLNETYEKEVSLEEKEDLKLDDSFEVQKGSELESGLKDLIEGKDETLVDEGLGHVSIAEISNEVENPIIKESQTDEVKETVDQSNLEGSENSENLTCEVEESSKLETLTEKSLDEDSIAIANNGSELNVTEEEEEEESDEDSSEEEEEEEESTESEVSDEESVEGDEDDVESEESDFESSLVDVKVVESQISIPSNDSHSRGQFDFVSEPKESSLVDAVIVQGEENKTPNGGSVSGPKIGPKTPFSGDQLSGQFPRPTPAKSSSKKAHPIIDTITDILDENDEEKEEELKNEESDNGDKNRGTKLCHKSLRELQKMLKSKLQIENEKEEKTRIALQTLPDNQIAVNALQSEN